MNVAFYICSVIAIVATAMVVTRRNAVHALLYLIISFLSVALIFFLIGAPFIAALEVIIYAGAIMVLFLFVIMMLNLGPLTEAQEGRWLPPGIWIGPGILGLVLLLLVGYVLFSGEMHPIQGRSVEPKQVGRSLFGPYVIGVQLAGLLLIAGLVGASHLRTRPEVSSKPNEKE